MAFALLALHLGTLNESLEFCSEPALTPLFLLALAAVLLLGRIVRAVRNEDPQSHS